MFTMEVYSVIIGSGTPQGLLGTSAAALLWHRTSVVLESLLGGCRWWKEVESIHLCSQSVCGV